MKIHIDEILKKRNKTRYWLAKNADLNYISVINLCDNTTTSIHFETLKKLCNCLKCTPNEIFGIKK